jgi:hypothetical protein
MPEEKNIKTETKPQIEFKKVTPKPIDNNQGTVDLVKANIDGEN